MNNINFNASIVNCEENDDLIIVGFADDQFATNQYVLIQRTLHPSRQDIKLELDGVHVEVNGPEISAYGGIDSIRLLRDEAEIRFGSKLKGKTGHDKVKVSFNIGDEQFQRLQETLRQLVGDRTKLIL